jgi:hypothetical protein
MPTDTKARRSLARWLIPAATFVIGLVVASMLGAGQAPAPAAVSVPTFGAAPEAQNSAAEAELALFRDINDKFVEQLRLYETRLRAIATTAEAEGATTAAGDMRDFALETELLIDRYDLILKE